MDVWRNGCLVIFGYLVIFVDYDFKQLTVNTQCDFDFVISLDFYGISFTQMKKNGNDEKV